MVVCASTLVFKLVFLFGLVMNSSLAHNHVYHVGELDGWTLLASGKYNHWAQKHRFHVNDDLIFKYQKGNDSVLVVGEDDYNKCNKKNPIHTLTDGYSKFKLTRPGPFFFISGHDQRCENGQKLTVVVLSDHHTPLSTAPSHAPPLHPPSHSPSPAAQKDSLPLPHSPSPMTPVHAPPPSNHSPSPSPTAQTPSHAPPQPSHAPPHSPAHAPPAPVSHHAPQPDADQSISLPPHHAPAPASASASSVLTIGLGVVVSIVSALIVV